MLRALPIRGSLKGRTVWRALNPGSGPLKGRSHPVSLRGRPWKRCCSCHPYRGLHLRHHHQGRGGSDCPRSGSRLPLLAGLASAVLKERPVEDRPQQGAAEAPQPGSGSLQVETSCRLPHGRDTCTPEQALGYGQISEASVRPPLKGKEKKLLLKRKAALISRC